MTTPDACPFAIDLLEAIPSLNARARGLCRNPADAQDLVQDTIARALSRIHQFEPGTNLRAWLQQILFHLFVSRRRRALREQASLSRLAAETWFASVEDSRAFSATALSPKLAMTFDSLPNKLATVVRKIDVDELSYREVADEMQIPIGTVMSRLWRGRRRLALAVSDDVLKIDAQAA
jgi:RNA polymerase sigma-70 factor (ECF subfamily)